MQSSNGGSLSDRVKNEKKAYDHGSVLEESSRLQARFSHVFQCPNSLAAEAYFQNQIKQLASTGGASVLDYGCSSGWFAPILKEWGFKNISGIDISETAIHDALKRHASIGHFSVRDAHNTQFNNNEFDLVVGRAILHHLDFEKSIQEIHRILKPGGKAIFIEPLYDNPVGQLIRKLNPKSRTLDERPLSQKQIEKSDALFGKSFHFFFGLSSVGIGLISSFISKNPQNFLLNLADRLDRLVSHTPLRYWMRQVVLVWEKKT